MLAHALPSNIQQFLSWQAHRYAQVKEKEPLPTAGPFVTISREYGCEGIPLASELAGRLNQISAKPTSWVVMGKEIIEAIAQKEGAAAEFVDALTYRRRGFIRQTVEVLFGNRPTEYQAYEKLVETLATLAGAGRVVLVGRGGGIVCGGLERGAHIRLVAPLQWRAEKIAKERKISVAEAEAIVSREGRERSRFVRDFTGKDSADPANYDFVFNNERNTVQVIADMVVSAMRGKGLA